VNIYVRNLCDEQMRRVQRRVQPDDTDWSGLHTKARARVSLRQKVESPPGELNLELSGNIHKELVTKLALTDAARTFERKMHKVF
jgi:hypothetical protein